MSLFRRNKNPKKPETVESPPGEKSKPEHDLAHRSADPKPQGDTPHDSSPQRVGIVSGVLSTSAESEGLSRFGSVVERRFGPSAELDSLPPRHVAVHSILNPPRDAFDERSVLSPPRDAFDERSVLSPPRDAFDEHEALQTVETDLDETDLDEDEDEDTESPKLEVDPMGLIGHATTIIGDIVAKEDLEIQGTIDGSVRLLEHTATIGSDGIVNATVEAHTVLVIGKITGDVIATELVEIKAGGVIGGDVKAPRVIMNDGAIVIGGLDMSAALPLGETPNIFEGNSASDSASESPKPDRPRLRRVELTNGSTPNESI